MRGRGSGKLRGAGSIGDTRKRPTGREGSRRRRCAAAAVLLCGGREGRCRWERRLPTGYRRSLTVSGSEWRVSPRVCLPALVRWACTALLGSADRDSERGRVPDPAPGVPVPDAVSPRSPPASSLLWSDRTSTATTTPTATRRRGC